MNDVHQYTRTTTVRNRWGLIVKVLIPVFIFWGVQVLTQVLVMLGDILIHLMKNVEQQVKVSQWIAHDTISISLFSLVLSSLLTIGLLSLMHIGTSRQQWIMPSFKEFVAYVALLLGMVVWVDFLLSWLQLPDWNNSLMSGLMQSPWGILTISLLGPVAEEFVFRAGVTERLLGYATPSVSILVSALIFGLVHINPPQIIGAGLLGILLAFSYYKTRSLCLPIMLHVINNSLAVGVTLYSTDKTESLRTLVSNDSGMWSYPILLVFAALIGVGGLYTILKAKK